MKIKFAIFVLAVSISFASCTKKDAVQASTTQAASNAQMLYEQFLSGSEKVYMDYLDGYDADNSQTLFQFIENDTYYGNYYPEVTDLSYAYIDCGNDGVPELALHVEYELEYGLFGKEYIIKEKDQKLQLYQIFLQEHHDGQMIGNEYGLILDSHYGPDSTMIDTYGFIDKDCKYHFLYSMYATGCPTMLMYGDGRFEADIDGDEWGELDDGNIYLTRYSFIDSYADMGEYDAGRMYMVEDVGTEQNDSILYKIFQQAGVKLYEWSEIEKKIEERKKELNVSDIILKEEPVQWQTLEGFEEINIKG